MNYHLEIFVAIVLCALFLFLLAPQKIISNGIFPWNWPFIKLMPTAYLKSHQLYDKMTQILAENNGTVLFNTSWFTKTDLLVTSDPVNVQHVMNAKFAIYQRGSEFRNIFDFLGEAVFIKDLDQWKEEKKFTHSFYKEIEFQRATPKIIHHTLEKALVPVLDDIAKRNQIIDLQSLFNRYMLDSTCIMATGFDLGSLRVGLHKSHLLDAMDDIAEAVFYRNILPERVWKLQRWLGIGKEKKMAQACNTFNQILHDYVTQKSKLSEKIEGVITDFDVLKFYLSQAGDNANNKAYLAANIMTLLFAGRDTSAALLSWFFHLISTNPLAEKRILDEIRENFPQEKYIFSKAEDLSKLVYLHCALYESLRLYPTAPVIIRDPTQEDVLPSGHKVCRTTKIILCSYAMGRMHEIWGEDCMLESILLPQEFFPERWISMSTDQKGSVLGIKHVASSNFLAFGAGPWACPGRELGFSRMKGVAATILHNFRVHVVEGQSASPSVSALLTMRHGLKATVSNRWI